MIRTIRRSITTLIFAFLTTVTPLQADDAKSDRDLETLQKRVSPFCLSEMQVIYMMNSEARQIGIYAKDEAGKVKVEEILNEYEGMFSAKRIYIRLPLDKISNDIASFRFHSYKKYLQSLLSETIQEIKKGPDNRDIYALTVVLDPDQKSVSISWNTEQAFAATLEKYRKGTSGENYKSAKNIQELKYGSGDFSFTSSASSKALNELLGAHSVKIAEGYSKFGEVYLNQIGPAYLHAIADASAAVIHELKPKILELNRTREFVSYVDLVDVRSDQRLLAIQKTVPDETILKVSGEVYGEFLK